jgi:hypothetical protein
VTIERFSFTTKILLQPYNFLRLHELIQMVFIILATVLIPFFLFKEASVNFESLKSKRGLLWAIVFITGVYFYATGNGVHELASFDFNTYCDPKNITNELCNGLFFNDYYTGNIMYFLGAGLMIIPLLFLERMKPNKTYTKKDVNITVINAVIYAFAIFAYSAFDKVLVGLTYSLIIMILADLLYLKTRKKYLQYPITFYTALTYTIGTVAAIILRFH